MIIKIGLCFRFIVQHRTDFINGFYQETGSGYFLSQSVLVQEDFGSGTKFPSKIDF